MRNPTRIVIALVAVLGLGGCEGAKQALGQGKRTPDEFAVYSRAPLSMPPDYGLRPPTPGRGKLEVVTPRDKARSVVLGERAAAIETRRPVSGDYTPGMLSIVKATGALQAEPGIRSMVDKETTILADEDKSVTERLMFWGTKNEYGKAVDAEKESKRIKENMGLGQPVTTGETPSITRKRKALLEDLFD